MQWFRMWAEFATDPVVQSLSFDDQRHFVMILCLKCYGVLDRKFTAEGDRHAVLSTALGICDDAFDQTKSRLMSRGLVTADWQPINWNKRQFVSDSDPTAAERKRRQRLREAAVTGASRVSHAPQITDNRLQITETEKNKKGADAPLVFPDGFAVKEWEEWIAHRKTRRMPCDRLTLQKQIAVLAPHTHDQQKEIIDRSINAGWQGLFAPKTSGAPKKPFKPKTPEELEALYGDRTIGEL